MRTVGHLYVVTARNYGLIANFSEQQMSEQSQIAVTNETGRRLLSGVRILCLSTHARARPQLNNRHRAADDDVVSQKRRDEMGREHE